MVTGRFDSGAGANKIITMRKDQAKDLLLTDVRIQSYKGQFQENEIPFEPVIDGIINKHGLQEYSKLIKAALEILEEELRKALAKPAKNRVGRWLRVIGKFFGLVK